MQAKAKANCQNKIENTIFDDHEEMQMALKGAGMN